MVVLLLAVIMIDHGVSARVTQLTPRQHHSFRAETPLSFELAVLSLDGFDHVTTKQHLGLCKAILEELLLVDANFVAEEVDEDVSYSFEELHVVQMHDVPVHTIAEKMFSHLA